MNSPEIFLYIDNVESLPKGTYHYNPFNHTLELLKEGDFKHELYKASLEQDQILYAAFTLVIVAIYDRAYSKYDLRAYRYVLLDCGHLGQNIYLVATALGLGTVCIGAFEDDKIMELFDLGERELTVSIYTVGKI